jgi:hypothetical protein
LHSALVSFSCFDIAPLLLLRWLSRWDRNHLCMSPLGFCATTMLLAQSLDALGGFVFAATSEDTLWTIGGAGRAGKPQGGQMGCAGGSCAEAEERPSTGSGASAKPFTLSCTVLCVHVSACCTWMDGQDVVVRCAQYTYHGDSTDPYAFFDQVARPNSVQCSSP